MEGDPFTASLFKWDPRGLVHPPPPPPPPPPQQAVMRQQWEQLGGLEELFSLYGIRYYTAAKIAELGFTARTLVNMTDQELDDMMTSLSHLFRWDLLVGERYGIKAAVRAERRRLHDLNIISNDGLSHEEFSEEGVVQQIEKETVASGGGGAAEKRKKQRRKGSKKKIMNNDDDDHQEDEEDDEGGDEGITNINSSNKMMIVSSERQREHPFIVTEPGEVARGKKNGLDYLFHLYDQCRDFLIQVQNIAKERGDKCPTKVTNEVFRYAKKAGASHINKPKMRHYVHCYALHCLDVTASNALRRAFKERGENVGAWRLACYAPLVGIAARQAAWDIDSIFNSHPLLSVWYVPTKLRHLCHSHRTASSLAPPPPPPPPPPPHHHHHHHLPFSSNA